MSSGGKQGSELLQGCNEQGRPTSPVTREACHGNPALVHMTVHLHVFDGRSRLYLQRRSERKDLYPGKWDTAVGGHVNAGESITEALRREAGEELGIDASGARFLHSYLHRNDHESEYVHTYGLVSEGPFRPNADEISEARFFDRAELDALLGTDLFTPNFKDEFERIKSLPLWRR